MTKELKQTTSEHPSNRRSRYRKDEEISVNETSPSDPSDEILENQNFPSKRVRIRLIPIWLRILIVLVLFVVAIVLGAMFGYAGLGEGEASDVFKKETWQHIFDIMNGVQ